MVYHLIETFSLARKYGNMFAVDDLNMRVPAGSIYGFLGPNGAGKTTTIRMILGLIKPTSGNMLLFGSPLNEDRQRLLGRIGALVESPSLYPHLTGEENLEVMRRLINAPRNRIRKVLQIVHLEDAATRAVKGYSTGMRQRLGIAAALMTDPSLLILDEPTNGLDPAGIVELREWISELPEKEGVTVFISSHMLSEVEQMATYIGIINHGHMVFQGTPDQLRSRYQESLMLAADQAGQAAELLRQEGWVVNYGGNHHLSIKVNGNSDAALINSRLVGQGFRIYHLEMKQPSLEDIFLTMTEKA